MSIVVYQCKECKKHFLDAENDNVALDGNMLILKISPAEYARKNIKIAGGTCEECDFTELPSVHAESIIEYMNDCNNSIIDDPNIPLSMVLEAVRKMDTNLDIGSLEVRLRAAANA